MMRDTGTVLLENVQIVSRNFAGKEGKYNDPGDRNFLVLLEPYVAQAMLDDGWNVKLFPANEETGERQAYLPVKVHFGVRPPRINMVSSRGRTPIHESDVEILDWVDIRTVDLVLRPHNWTIGEKTGKKAYLQTMYITIEDDLLDNKYRDLEDLPARGGRVD